MAATASSGYVLEDSGTTSLDVPQISITRDRSIPASASETVQGISKPSPETASTNQTFPPSATANTTSSHAASSCQPAINNETSDAQKPDFITTQTVKVNRVVNHFNDFKQELTKTSIADSHVLAREDHDIKGEVQRQPLLEGKVKDLGWHKKLNEMPDPLIGGVSNQTLFAKIRRFNKVRTPCIATPILSILMLLIRMSLMLELCVWPKPTI